MTTEEDRDREPSDAEQVPDENVTDAMRGQSGYAAGYRGEPRDRSREAMGYGGYGGDPKSYRHGRPGYGSGGY